MRKAERKYMKVMTQEPEVQRGGELEEYLPFTLAVEEKSGNIVNRRNNEGNYKC